MVDPSALDEAMRRAAVAQLNLVGLMAAHGLSRRELGLLLEFPGAVKHAIDDFHAVLLAVAELLAAGDGVERWAALPTQCKEHYQALAYEAVMSAPMPNAFLITKQPGSDFAVPPHQDGINARLRLDPAASVAVWLAITDATLNNGCLHVVPGSHRSGYLPYERHGETVEGGRPLTVGQLADELEFVPVPVAGGQACAMDVRLVHRSHPNRSTRPRVGLNVRYVAPGAVTVLDGSDLQLFPVAGDRW
jgi:ectoine hydroxylase-related dioxygenase (phytanoyl-CoA dioxygenase family)